MLRLKEIMFVLLLAITCSANTYGWGYTEHRVICQLAYEKLDDKAKGVIDNLLHAMPKKHRRNLNKYLRRAYNTPIRFADSCAWADAIRDLSDYKRFASWHYVNVERNRRPVSLLHCRDACILSAIPHHFDSLKSGSNVWQRSQALMFLGHWIGDIHQPLHVSFRDDRGGNKVFVSINGEIANLHRIWDREISQWAKDNYRWTTPQLAANVRLSDTISYSKHYTQKQVLVWAEESRLIAQSLSLGYCRGDESCESYKSRTRVFAASYYREHWPIVRTRMKLAAERLATTLEAAL